MAGFKLDITHVLSSCVAVQDTARDLGVIIDSQLSLSAHVTAVCRSGYYQLHHLRQAVRSLSEDASKTLVQAFVSCHLDYCNSLFFGISEGLMNRLQSVQNAAAHRVTGTRCSDHISPVLHQLHWLPVCPLQGGHVRPPVVVWRFVTVPGRRLPPCRQCS